jgi:hypothetical protein
MGMTLFQAVLLRKSVGGMVAQRDRCHDCARTPLVGERVHVYVHAGGERLVCDLCRRRRRETPASTRLMHSPEHERAVRVVARVA